MSIVQPDAEYSTERQEEEIRSRQPNATGQILGGLLGNLAMAGMTYAALRGRGKGLGKLPKSPRTGVPASQFSAEGLGRVLNRGKANWNSATAVAKRQMDPLKAFAQNAGRVGKKAVGQARTAVRTGVQRATKAISKRTDTIGGANLFAGKGPNEMREGSRKGRKPPPKIRTNVKKLPTIAEETPRATKAASATSPSFPGVSPVATPRRRSSVARPKATNSQQNLLRRPTPFTQSVLANFPQKRRNSSII